MEMMYCIFLAMMIYFGSLGCCVFCICHFPMCALVQFGTNGVRKTCISPLVVLAHLSPRLKVSYCDRLSPSSVRPSVRRKLFHEITSLPEPLVLHMNVPHNALFQNCINGSAPLNRRIARAPDKKSFKRHLLLNH